MPPKIYLSSLTGVPRKNERHESADGKYSLKDLVSVLIPCFNAEKWICESIESCLRQSHKNIEIIIVDDGSKDESLHVIKKGYGEKVRCIQSEHRGAAAARNLAFKHCRGEFVQYLDADDLIAKHKLRNQLDYMESSHADVVYSDFRGIDGDLRKRRPIQRKRQHGDFIWMLLNDKEEDFIGTGAYLYKRKVIQDCGGWDEDLSVEDDHFFNFKVAFHGARICHSPGCYFYYRRNHAPSLSDWHLQPETAEKALASITTAYRRMEAMLRDSGGLTPTYMSLLIHQYERLGREWQYIDPETTDKILKWTCGLNEQLVFESNDIAAQDPPDKLMVVAHPDDESLFGGAALLEKSGWKVICVTNFKNPVRREEFLNAMKFAGCRKEMWDYPDELMTPFNEDQLINDLQRVIGECNWRMIVTHNELGEYGHIHHFQLNKLMRELVGEKLYVFDTCVNPIPEELWWRKNDLVGCYYSQQHNCRTHMQYGRFEKIVKDCEFSGIGFS